MSVKILKKNCHQVFGSQKSKLTPLELVFQTAGAINPPPYKDRVKVDGEQTGIQDLRKIPNTLDFDGSLDIFHFLNIVSTDYFFGTPCTILLYCLCVVGVMYRI